MQLDKTNVMSLPKGRPSNATHRKIKEELRPYYEQNLSAAFTARQTGYNIKTICNYFNEWSKAITQSGDDFLSRQRQERENIILGFDGLIYEEYQLLDEVKATIKKHKERRKAIPTSFISAVQDCIKTISGLIEKKSSYTLVLPSDEIIEKKIEEILKKNVSK